MTRRLTMAALAGVLVASAGASATALATPTISGADTDGWGVTNPVPTYAITAGPNALTPGINWSLDDGGTSTGPSPLTVKLPGLADGLHVLSATDGELLATGAALRTFRVDLTPPKITVNRPSSGAQIDLNATVTADYACQDAVTCVGSVAPGSAIATSTAGSATFTVRATDRVGNESISIVSYTVRDGSGAGTGSPAEPISLVQDPAGGTITTTRRGQPYKPRTINAIGLRPRAGLLIPTRRPLLRWTARKGARLYNVQVFWLHGTKATKVVSVFPTGHNLRIPAGRVAFGHTYIWRVWPYVRGKYTKRPLGLSYFSVRRQAR